MREGVTAVQSLVLLVTLAPKVRLVDVEVAGDVCDVGDVRGAGDVGGAAGAMVLMSL